MIEYTLTGVRDAEDLYRLVTTIADPERAPAVELAALYHERWEVKTAFDELKTHLRGAKVVLRSKTPDLVRQEFYGVLLAHFAVRGLMHGPRGRPTRIRTSCRTCMQWVSSAANCRSPWLVTPRARPASHETLLVELAQDRVVPSRGRRVPRSVKRKMSKFPRRPPQRRWRARVARVTVRIKKR